MIDRKYQAGVLCALRNCNCESSICPVSPGAVRALAEVRYGGHLGTKTPARCTRRAMRREKLCICVNPFDCFGAGSTAGNRSYSKRDRGGVTDFMAALAPQTLPSERREIRHGASAH